MSVANETRERALREMGAPLSEMKVSDLMTLTGEGKFLADLSLKLSMPLSEMLDRLWSSDVTDYRAAALVDQAATDIAGEIAEREAKRNRLKGRRR